MYSVIVTFPKRAEQKIVCTPNLDTARFMRNHLRVNDATVRIWSSIARAFII